MAGRGSSTAPCDLLGKIKGFVRSLVEGVCSGRLPMVSLDRYRTYCSDLSGDCCCNLDFPCGKEIISFEKESHARRLEQAVVDQAINDICILLQCSRHNLNVVPAGKGLVMGWLRFEEGGRKFDCLRSPNTAYPIPVHVEEVKDVMSIAKYILVVEKETVFQRLANDKFCEANSCIVITGRGYPDVPTRRFLRHLKGKLCLPIYCLVDCDPYGFDILMTYRFGSMEMAYDASLMRVPEIRWLGVFPSDHKKYELPDRCLLPLTPEDRKRAEAMSRRCYLHHESPRWRFELDTMLQDGKKFEIEALSVSSFSFLSDEYIPAKIRDGLYI